MTSVSLYVQRQGSLENERRIEEEIRKVYLKNSKRGAVVLLPGCVFREDVGIKGDLTTLCDREVWSHANASSSSKK